MTTEKTSISLWEVAGIVALCFGWFIVGSIAAVFNRADDFHFSDSALLQTLLLELFLGFFALLILRQRGHALKDLIPRPNGSGLAIGGSLYLISLLVFWIATALTGGNFAEQPVARMLAESRPSMAIVVPLSLVNGSYEEIFLLGYVARALGKYGGSLAIGVSTLIRLSYHTYQGPLGALSVTIFGIILGAYYWRTRDLWSCMAAHTIADILGFLLR